MFGVTESDVGYGLNMAIRTYLDKSGITYGEYPVKGVCSDHVSFEFGTNGYIFAIDPKTNQILAHKNKALIGTDAAAAGFPAAFSTDTGVAYVDGIKCYYVVKNHEDMLIGTMMPANEYYSVRLSQTVVVSASMFMIFWF